MKKGYSQANDVLHPLKRFPIGKRWLNLYENKSLSSYTSACYTLYWEGEKDPVQHRMNWFEILDVLAGLLDDTFVCQHCHEIHEEGMENSCEPKTE